MDLLAGLARGGQQRVTVSGRSLNYDELLAASSAVASQLEAVSRVAVLATPTLETVVAVTAALLAGVEVVPVPPDSGRAELSHLLADSQPQAWVGETPTATTLPVIPADPTARSTYSPPPVGPGRIAFVLYTSGTTGLPKGVLLSRRAVAAGLDALIDAWAWTSRDVLAHGLPLFHVHGLILGVLGPLRVGGELIHVGRGTPERYAGAASEPHPPSMYFAVPTIWSRIAEHPEQAAALKGARLLVSGSAALPAPVFDRLHELTGLRVAERYGMSETLITVATRADGSARAGWVGVPVAGVQTRLRDDHDEPVPADGESVGRLEVRGATLFEGYLNRPEETARAWTDDGWFRTGDVAIIDPRGAHRIVGRESVDLIKSAGYRIGAGEIESTLLGHPRVAEVAVVGEPDPDLGQRLVAYVVPRGDLTPQQQPALAAELTAYVGAELSAHKRPREVRFTASLPRNEMGKVQKALL